MNWLDKNPIGTALVSACGLLLVFGVALTFLWSGPGSTEGTLDGAEGGVDLPEIVEARELGPLGEYEVIVNRPVFNDTRRPILIDEAAPEEVVEMVQTEAVSAPPAVRLTGVVITPTERVVTLTPEAGGEALVIREGMPLDGQYVGWSVKEVSPRTVRLTSAQGQNLDFELAVHDAMIAKPPEPQPVEAPTEVAAVDGAEGEVAADGNRSRADEIRERIRQRREQLRAEAEQQSEDAEGDQEAKTNAYQSAIQSMIRRGNNEEQSESDDSGDN